jgi:transposase
MAAETDRLTKLEQQRAEIERKIKQERRRVKDEQRRRDTRRKIILGGLIEAHCEMHPDTDFAREVDRLVGRFVTGSGERELFGLQPLPQQEGAGEGAANDAADDKGGALAEAFQDSEKR